MTDEKQGTISDIVAEMRHDAQGALDHTVWPHTFEPGDILAYAERIEAAAKRERIQRDKVCFRCGDCANFGGDCGAGDVDGNEDCIACEKFRRRASLGNTAALREALEAALYCLREIHTVSGYTVEDTIEMVRDALAKPPRNCDVYRTKEEAEKAFLSEPCDEPCGNCTISDINNECGVKWLFAKAKGKEESNG